MVVVKVTVKKTKLQSFQNSDHHKVCLIKKEKEKCGHIEGPWFVLT